MLSYAKKRRVLLVIIAVILLIGILATPLRRDYAANYVQTKSQPGALTPSALNKTNIHYGVPLTWLSLTKATDPGTQKTTSMKVIEAKNLLIDLGVWAGCLLLIGFVMRIDNAILPPREQGV